jgi:uncharacterized protein YndB with AHSA1/START domain
MSVTAIHKDPDSLSMTVTAEFDASPERVWQLWADPRKLERWWGPPTYPATVTDHDLRPGGRIAYYMTGPEGDQPAGYWDVLEVDEPRTILIRDGFADADGDPLPDMPRIVMKVTIEEITSGRTRMSIADEFESVEAMEQLLGMGMEEGISQAIGQIEDILAEDAAVS